MDEEQKEQKEDDSGALYFVEDHAESSFYIGINAGERLEKAIKGAKKSIKIISPFLGEDALELLRQKCLGGVKDITLVTYASKGELKTPNNLKALKKLYGEYGNESFCRCFFLKKNRIHAKLYLIDDEIAYTGSLNFTKNGLFENHESCFTITNQETVHHLSDYVEKIFKTNFHRWNTGEIKEMISRFEAENKTKPAAAR